jgi:predicted transcriptional regulator
MKLDRKDSTNFTLRMSVEQRLALEKIAAKEDRTITNLINVAIKRYIEMYNGVKKEGRD